MPPDKFRARADEIATGAHIRGEEFKAVCAGGIEAMVVAATAGGELTPEDTAHITTLAQAFGVDLHALPSAGLRLAKASVLRELKEGKLLAGSTLKGPWSSISSAMNWCRVFNDVACYSIARGDKAATPPADWSRERDHSNEWVQGAAGERAKSGFCSRETPATRAKRNPLGRAACDR